MIDEPSKGVVRDDPRVGETIAAAQGTTYVIAIGIDEYTNFPPWKSFANKNCEKDCRDFLAVLTDRYENCIAYKEKTTDPDVLVNRDAGKQQIVDRLTAFAEGSSNAAANNLIVYFSGHGGEQTFGVNNTGFWAAYDSTDKARHGITYADLSQIIVQLKTQHFILIVDACRAGQLVLNLGLKGTVGERDPAERSKWVLVSSRNDEDAKAGGPNQNSAFTKELLMLLGNQDMYMSQLCAALQNRFMNNDSQKPAWGRMKIHGDNINNSGDYLFKLKSPVRAKIQNEQQQAERRSTLWKSLRGFNYTYERRTVRNFVIQNNQNLIIVFRGTQQCGLRHASLQSKRNVPELGDSEPLCVMGSKIPTASTAPGFVFFNLLFPQYPTPEALTQFLEVELTKRHLYFFLTFSTNTVGNKKIDQVLPSTKKLIVDGIASFMQSVPNGGQWKFICFVIDEDNLDYTQHYPTRSIQQVNTLILDPPRTVEPDVISDWYDAMRLGQECTTSFDTMFPGLGSAIAQIATAQHYPGAAIEEICKQAQCTELITTILQPF